jgi:hypothetical protein
MFRLVRSLNAVQDAPMDIVRLTKAFDRWWPELDSDLVELKATVEASTSTTSSTDSQPDRESGEILQEVLHLLRDQRRAVARLEQDAGKSTTSNLAGIIPAEGIFQLRTAQAERVLSTLFGNYHAVYESPEKMTLILKKPPAAEALNTLDAWARANAWDVRVESPGHIHQLGPYRSDPDS